MEINTILLQNFNDELKTYLKYNRNKEDEYYRMNYFSSKVLFAEHIDYEKEKGDL
jgi:hypothetical protein